MGLTFWAYPVESETSLGGQHVYVMSTVPSPMSSEANNKTVLSEFSGDVRYLAVAVACMQGSA